MSDRMSDRERTVLIASTHNDKKVWGPIVDQLPPGLHVEVFEGDAIASRRRPLSIDLSNAGMTVRYDGRVLALGSIAAAFYLRPNLAYPSGEHWTDYLSDEQARGIVYDTLWRQVPKDRWLNHPDTMRQLIDPMKQLLIAQEAGFDIPHTLVASDEGDVLGAYPNGAVHKRAPRLIYGSDGTRVMQTLHIHDIAQLPLNDYDPLTSHWQDHVDGRVWHAMAIGSRVFSAYWHASGKPPRMRYVPAPLPPEMQDHCRDYLRIAELGMGAFSLVEHSGTMTCTGFNPYGHPGWMDNELHQPVFETIARELATIAMRE